MFQPLIERDGLDTLKSKFRVCTGDLAKNRLGLSREDYTEITSHVTCVLHLAATVNFNERIQLAVAINILGSKRVVQLAKDCHNLSSVVHTSTCYVNCTRTGNEEIGEKIYPISFDPHALVDQILDMTPEEADAATAGIIHPHPNTYTFTKFVAEHITHKETADLPYAIVRPSIIGASLDFPVPGWVDSYIGAAGLMAAHGLGVLHCMVGKPEAIFDLIPVDLVANKILTVAYRTATKPEYAGKIYHASSSTSNPITWEGFRMAANYHNRVSPFKNRIGPAYAFPLSRTGIKFQILHYTTSVAPAALADFVAYARGKKMKNVSQTRMIGKIVRSLRFFTSHGWKFSNQNSLDLSDELALEDRQSFPDDPRRIYWAFYLTMYFQGVRMYLLKEEVDNYEHLPFATL
eukprot:TRINITY_DN12294_c0_g1_i1.p1 TRINITY_DN12294_c0_g1~~TRINITY_DN12294_c0_g1_i1.p1  ORF type:complete len:425 (-),score=70.03 TRINITY_DN12294_c0_g1_i1:163-1377(-)